MSLAALTMYFSALHFVGGGIDGDIKITLFAFMAAYVASLTAIGGGFVFMPMFYIFYSVAPATALSLSIITQSVGMSAGTLGWRVQNLDLIHLKAALLAGGIGVLIGTLVLKPDISLILQHFGVLSLILGGASLAVFTKGIFFRSESVQPRVERRIGGPSLYSASYLAVCFGGGIFTAWTSIGIGEVVALWLLIFVRRPLEIALATGVAALAFCSIVGAALQILVIGDAPWGYLSYTIPGVLFGGFLGATTGRIICNRKDGDGWKFRITLKMFFSLIILADGAYILVWGE